MGLDITAYSNLKRIDAVFNKDGEPVDPTTREPIDGDYYQPIHNPHYDRADGLTEGVFRYEKAIGHRAGSYSGYNLWREELAKLAGWPLGSYEFFGDVRPSHAASAWKATEGPFFELINFSDCEGTIGAVTSKKLALDFAEYQAKADAHEDEYFRMKYKEWRAAFELAANAGAVNFH